MQGLPQPPDQPNVDGCLIVELPDDAIDVEYLLRALYSSKFLHQPALSIGVISALIRLGRKYEFRDILDSAVERITLENPTTLEDYANLYRDADGKYIMTRIVPDPGVPFDLVNLARENNIVSALPALYYRAACGGLEALLDSVSRNDGTFASLAPVDLRRCILGREKIVNAQFEPDYTWGWLQSEVSDNDCFSPQKCTQARDSRLRKYTLTVGIRALAKFDPGAYKDMCRGCKQSVRELAIAGRKKLWDDLPGFFDLPSWAELSNDV
ncbi:hypothetical protein B0H19DRAFT_1090601 [Mycena capillaripes]|nr:hypothetical protein B0H19DRAFT_1090601 [Mycena capillaripes]